jgi:hypothetical protein
MEYMITGGRRQGKAALWQMLGVAEQVRGFPWWREIELRVRGWLPGWTPWRRPQPASAYGDICMDLWASMRNKDMPMTRDDYLQMVSYHRLAFENTLRGSASEESWGCLALASNIALVLAELGYGEDYIAMIQQGQDALLRAKERGEKSASWRLDGMGAKTIGDMLDVLDAQLEIATRAEIMDARNIILQRMADQEAAEAAKVDAVP